MFQKYVLAHHDRLCDKEPPVSDLYRMHISLSFSQLNIYHNLHVRVRHVKYRISIATWDTTLYKYMTIRTTGEYTLHFAT